MTRSLISAAARRTAAWLPALTARDRGRRPQQPATGHPGPDTPGRSRWRRWLLGPANPEYTAAAVCALVVLYYGTAEQLPWTTPPGVLALAGLYGAGTAYLTACHVAVRARRTGATALAVTALSPLVTLTGWLLLADQAPHLVRPVAAWSVRHAGDLITTGLGLGLVLGAALICALMRGCRRPAPRSICHGGSQGHDC